MSTHATDEWDFDDPVQQAAHIRQSNLEYWRKQKAGSPLAGLTDLGIALTPDEEQDVRAYAEKMGVSFERTLEDFAAKFIVIPDRSNTKLYQSLVDRRTIPRNLLSLCLKTSIYRQAGKP